MNIPNEVWTKILSLMEEDMTATTIQTWFDEASPVCLDENTFILRHPSEFKRNIIQSRYLPFIQQATAEGWEPVTYAKADDPAIALERYGTKYITVLNDSDETKSFQLTFDDKLDITGFTDVLTGKAYHKDDPITLDGEDVAMLELIKA